MIKYHDNIEQGTEEWHALRCGVLTASNMKHVITPTYKIANNDKTRALVYEIAAQRITGYTEETFQSFKMQRGHVEEEYAREVYSQRYAPVKEMGFVTNDRLGFVIGFSPDGLVGEDGGTEMKSRDQRFQVQTIVDWEVPSEHDIQVQASLFMSERKWWDYVQYSNGMPMTVIRVYPDPKKQAVIEQACFEFEQQVQAVVDKYNDKLKTHAEFLTPTERKDFNEVEVEYEDE